MAANIPCRNPKVCGVKSHRAGTQARCMNVPNRKVVRRDYDDMDSGLAAVGGHGRVKLQNRPEPYPLDDRGHNIERDIQRGIDNIEVELPEGDLGEKRFLLINANAGGQSTYDMSKYWGQYMNRREAAKIVTASGAEVYAGSHPGGSHTRCVFKDGVVRTGPVIPINREAELMDSHMTAAEYDSLCDLDQEAEALGYTESSEWSDLEEKEIIGRAVDMAKDGWDYRLQLHENGSEIKYDADGNPLPHRW